MSSSIGGQSSHESDITKAHASRRWALATFDVPSHRERHPVAASWQALAGELVPLALVVALSPLSVLPPLLLVLHAARPRAAGLAFALGWLGGLGASTAIFLLLPRALGGTHEAQ